MIWTGLWPWPGPPADWEQKLAAVTSVLENLQATVNSGTVLDASSTSELKQQQLNLKLKAKVREQKLQKQVEELEEELAAARKSAEVRPQPAQPMHHSLSVSFGDRALALSQAGGGDSVGAVAGLAKDFVIVHNEIQTLRKEVLEMKKELSGLSSIQGEHLAALQSGKRSNSMVRMCQTVLCNDLKRADEACLCASGAPGNPRRHPCGFCKCASTNVERQKVNVVLRER